MIWQKVFEKPLRELKSKLQMSQNRYPNYLKKGMKHINRIDICKKKQQRLLTTSMQKPIRFGWIKRMKL